MATCACIYIHIHICACGSIPTSYPLSESTRSIQILVGPSLTQTPNCKLTETIAPDSVTHYILLNLCHEQNEMYQKTYSVDTIITKILLKKEHRNFTVILKEKSKVLRPKVVLS